MYFMQCICVHVHDTTLHTTLILIFYYLIFTVKQFLNFHILPTIYVRS